MYTYLRAALILILITGTAQAGPGPDLWERWTAHDAGSSMEIDYSGWGDFIKRYRVMDDSGVAMIRYRDVTDEDRAGLQNTINRLADLPISEYNRDVQQAYWLNLYNALTVDVILDHYPTDSIRSINISPGWFARGPWGAELVKVEGEPLTLDDIEHRILRPIWEDPRIHYGVNCASIGCPNLQQEPFTAENTDRLLVQGARAYINSSRGVSFSDGRLTVSSIYHWFQEDFGNSPAGVIRHLLAHADPEFAAMLEQHSGYDNHAYDWSLNEFRNE